MGVLLTIECVGYEKVFGKKKKKKRNEIEQNN